jgi:hypothetical protein
MYVRVWSQDQKQFLPIFSANKTQSCVVEAASLWKGNFCERSPKFLPRKQKDQPVDRDEKGRLAGKYDPKGFHP